MNVHGHITLPWVVEAEGDAAEELDRFFISSAPEEKLSMLTMAFLKKYGSSSLQMGG